MKLQFFILFIFLIQISLVISSRKKHQCMHDEMDHDIHISPYSHHTVLQQEKNQRRNLEISNPESIRITYDTSELENLPSGFEGVKQTIEKQLEIAKNWLTDKLLIQRATSNLIFPSNISDCISAIPQESDKTTGIPDSDLHIYVIFFNDSTKTTLANAGACILDSATKRPIFGRINYNIHYLNGLDTNDNLEFEDNLEVTLHEITHILGFSGGMIKYWLNPETGSSYGADNQPIVTETVRNRQTNWITTNQIKQTAQDHYNCSNIIGMQLENQGGSGSLGSHWERTILQNEFMTASAISTDAAYSRFTFALLEDTGWYKPIYEGLDKIQWGLNKGCDFLTSCDQSQFREFEVQSQKGCTFYHSAMGVSGSETYSDECFYVRPYSNGLCTDTNNINSDNDPYTANYYGQNSKCFSSDVVQQGVTFSSTERCHEYQCIDNIVNIKISNELYPCVNNEAIIIKKGQNQKYIGTVVCPVNQQLFCNEYPQPCKNYCSQNGYCQQSVCHCNDNFAGEACDISCADNKPVEDGVCVPNCSSGKQVRIPDKVCIQVTIVCNIKCGDGNCDNPNIDPNTCTSCNSSTRDSSNNCECKVGFQETDPISEDCLLVCQYPCDTCSNTPTNCLTCKNTFQRISTTNCDCQTGFYDDNTLCQKCSHQCSTCQNNSDTCTQCSDLDNRVEDSSCNCKIGYYDDGSSAKCQECSYKCSECDKNGCTKCSDLINRINDQSCNCKDTFYDDGQSQQCQPCVYPCLHCTSQTICTQCTDYVNRNSDCTCETGYINQNTSCIKCNYKCGQCKTDQNTCQTCYNNSFRDINKNCECNIQYYENPVENSVCSRCNIPCLDCDSSDNCLSCISGQNREDHSLNCICKQGFYENNSNQCVNCDSNCLTCSQAGSCDTCINTENRESKPGCLCTLGYFQNNNKECQKCNYKCKSCDDHINCTACADPSNRTQNGCACKDGFYNEGTNPICQECVYPCQNCSSSTNCLTCKTTLNRQQNQECTCNTGYFDDQSQCQKCLHQCKTCQNNNDQCMICSDIVNRDINQQCNCKQGFYDDGINAECKKCSYKCSQCDKNGCLACSDVTNRINDSNCNCKDTFYDDGTTQQCQPCQYPCKNCTSNIICTSCTDTNNRKSDCTCDIGFEDVNQKCVQVECQHQCNGCQNNQPNKCLQCSHITRQNSPDCNCIAKFYNEGTNKECQACIHPCLECESSIICKTCVTGQNRQDSSKNCICKQNYYEDSNKNCQKCSEKCMGCTDTNICIQCVNTLNRNDKPGCNCVEGFYQDSENICQECNYKCKSCTQQNICDECNDFNNRINESCGCKNEYYDDGSSPECKPCQYPCLHCTSQTVCISCINNINRKDNQSCYCATGFYDDDSECQKCSYQCESCKDNATTCIQCSDLVNRIQDSICSCSIGFYDDGQSAQCQKCSYKCSQCDKNGCTVCSDTNNRINDSDCNCKNTFYDDGKSPQCLPCQYPCLNCTSDTDCTSCVDNINRNNDCTCKTGYSEQNQQCQIVTCVHQCQSCVLGTTDQCQSCSDVNRDENKQCQCKDTYYNQGVDPICQKCQHPCLLCDSNTNCLSCIEGNFRQNVDNNCICIKGYFENNEEDCLKCEEKCETCSSKSTCNTCINTLNRNNPPNCTCIDGYYQDNNLNCQKCNYRCAQCENITGKCTICSNNTRDVNTNCECKDTFFEIIGQEQQQCSQCQFPCQKCNQNQCLSCPVNSNRTIPTCDCAKKYYQDDNNVCQPCIYPCLLCSAQKKCESCFNQLNRSIFSEDCHCNTGYFDNQNECQKCQLKCNTCSDLNTCITCAGNLRDLNNNCICKQGYYEQQILDNDGNIEQISCQRCQYPCDTCQYINKVQICDSCIDNINRKNNCECQDGYFSNNENQCQECDYNCQKCKNSSNYCTECKVGNKRQLVTPQCGCITGFQNDGNNIDCIEVNYDCQTIEYDIDFAPNLEQITIQFQSNTILYNNNIDQTNKVIVTLSYFATFKPQNDLIKFNDNILQKSESFCLSNQQFLSKFILKHNASFLFSQFDTLIPQVDIQGTNRYTQCQNIKLQAIPKLNDGKRKLQNIQWQIVETSKDFDLTFNNQKLLNQQSLLMNYSAEFLQPHIDYKFQVQFQNFLEVQNTQQYTISIESGLVISITQIDTINELFLNEQKSIRFNVLIQQCQQQIKDIEQYTIKYQINEVLSTNSQIIIKNIQENTIDYKQQQQITHEIQPYTHTLNKMYFYQLKVELVQKEITISEQIIDYQNEFKPQEYIVYIEGGHSQIIRKENHILKGIAIDQDIQDQELQQQGFEYKWKCKNSIDLTPCQNQNGEILVFEQKQEITIDYTQFTQQEVIFYLEIEKNSRTQYAETKLLFEITNNVPKIVGSISNWTYSKKVRVNEVLQININYKNSLQNFENTRCLVQIYESNNLNNLLGYKKFYYTSFGFKIMDIIDVQDLKIDSLILKIEVSDSKYQYSQIIEFNIQLNIPPTIGFLEFDKILINSLDEKLTIKAQNFNDSDQPLQYKFYYYNSKDSMEKDQQKNYNLRNKFNVLTDFQYSQEIQTYLPSSKDNLLDNYIYIMVEVADQMGSISSTIYPIKVIESQKQNTQDKIQELYSQSKNLVGVEKGQLLCLLVAEIFNNSNLQDNSSQEILSQVKQNIYNDLVKLQEELDSYFDTQLQKAVTILTKDQQFCKRQTNRQFFRLLFQMFRKINRCLLQQAQKKENKGLQFKGWNNLWQENICMQYIFNFFDQASNIQCKRNKSWNKMVNKNTRFRILQDIQEQLFEVKQFDSQEEEEAYYSTFNEELILDLNQKSGQIYNQQSLPNSDEIVYQQNGNQIKSQTLSNQYVSQLFNTQQQSEYFNFVIDQDEFFKEIKEDEIIQFDQKVFQDSQLKHFEQIYSIVYTENPDESEYGTVIKKVDIKRYDHDNQLFDLNNIQLVSSIYINFDFDVSHLLQGNSRFLQQTNQSQFVCLQLGNNDWQSNSCSQIYDSSTKKVSCKCNTLKETTVIDNSLQFYDPNFKLNNDKKENNNNNNSFSFFLTWAFYALVFINVTQILSIIYGIILDKTQKKIYPVQLSQVHELYKKKFMENQKDIQIKNNFSNQEKFQNSIKYKKEIALEQNNNDTYDNDISIQGFNNNNDSNFGMNKKIRRSQNIVQTEAIPEISLVSQDFNEEISNIDMVSQFQDDDIQNFESNIEETDQQFNFQTSNKNQGKNSIKIQNRNKRRRDKNKEDYDISNGKQQKDSNSNEKFEFSDESPDKLNNRKNVQDDFKLPHNQIKTLFNQQNQPIIISDDKKKNEAKQMGQDLDQKQQQKSINSNNSNILDKNDVPKSQKSTFRQILELHDFFGILLVFSENSSRLVRNIMYFYKFNLILCLASYLTDLSLIVMVVISLLILQLLGLFNKSMMFLSQQTLSNLVLFIMLFINIIILVLQAINISNDSSQIDYDKQGGSTFIVLAIEFLFIQGLISVVKFIILSKNYKLKNLISDIQQKNFRQGKPC